MYRPYCPFLLVCCLDRRSLHGHCTALPVPPAVARYLG